jgi:hypothetical protein
MLVAGLLLKLLIGGTAFGLARIDQPPLKWTSADAVLASVEVPLGSNLFEVQTEPIAERLAALPAVAAARVSVSLPDGLVIGIDERVPILAWQVGPADYLVDRDGVLFAAATPAAIGADHLPMIIDSRASSSSSLAIGAHLDPVDLDAATRLGALVPSDVASSAAALQVSVGDTEGYVLSAGAGSWTAVFGFYSPSLRSTEIIPGQVRLLRSLLAGREARVARVILADAQNGTYVPKATSR